MKVSRIAVVFLLSILLASGLGCGLIGGDSTPTEPPSPTLSSPVDGATLNGTSITFQWQASAGATEYALLVSTNPNFPQYNVFFGRSIGNVNQYTLSGFPDDGTVYYWGVRAGNGEAWSNKNSFIKNSRSFTSGVRPLGGASLTPQYLAPTQQIVFKLTAWAQGPSDLLIYNPDDSLLAKFYVPPEIESASITEYIYLPPAPIGGTYRFEMYGELTGDIGWYGEQSFQGPILVAEDWSLNPSWVRGIGWDLRYLTMKLKNTGDMPIILYDLKLKLEKDGFSTQEITIARPGDAEAKYGWLIPGLIWQLLPSKIATIVSWNSTEQHLFGQFFDPGKYQMYFTLSDQLQILEENELYFESS